ncbi:ABC transporter [Vibrio nigripulchritudo ATCC 27043]|uniref:ABC transporter ATP-binding protein n=1 Tax=Vibrio nigripulchritudo TaxID=28173 RepID=UPI00021C3E17|nr:ABC transporter ATP-binding protein [Vibrio nigripulchritudo]EGU61311.1 ABC transporter [Vibrio nigripulchritudo ATCC 27043]BDU39899.1 spermidine/putrescine import ATP-binding protein PotA 2 [Vibrio nigripulchritudo]BDU45623.1 spermidine/putrescine import ATP-binding protein PotA 2 [Vibrio nigripulchritudo]CCN70803.1 Spermidine/putrescine import ATP-binding protein potA [Vibrio nigripulchritudo SFn118]
MLQIKNVTKKFGDFVASENISFEAKAGEFVTLLGPSGCGKTTLLKMIGGFLTVDSGEILIDGQRIDPLPPEKRSTAMCFQSYALFPHLSVSHNICFGLVQKNMPLEQQKTLLSEAISQVGLEDHKDKLPAQLSGGQQQRVALARAMVMRPDVILFDEPLSNLDAKLRESVRFEIKSLQKEQNLTTVYVTHDQAEALAMSDKIVVLNKGSIEQIGTPEEIYYQPKNRFVADFIGAANILPARVSPTDQANLYKVECELGSFLTESQQAPVAERIYICWRPESAHLANSDEENCFHVQVENLAFLGNVTDLFGRAADEPCGQKIRIQLHQSMSSQPGDKVAFKMSRNAIRFLEEVKS